MTTDMTFFWFEMPYFWFLRTIYISRIALTVVRSLPRKSQCPSLCIQLGKLCNLQVAHWLPRVLQLLIDLLPLLAVGGLVERFELLPRIVDA